MGPVVNFLLLFDARDRPEALASGARNQEDNPVFRRGEPGYLFFSVMITASKN
jgi:hypothetical protein